MAVPAGRWPRALHEWTLCLVLWALGRPLREVVVIWWPESVTSQWIASVGQSDHCWVLVHAFNLTLPRCLCISEWSSRRADQRACRQPTGHLLMIGGCIHAEVALLVESLVVAHLQFQWQRSGSLPSEMC